MSLHYSELKINIISQEEVCRDSQFNAGLALGKYMSQHKLCAYEHACLCVVSCFLQDRSQAVARCRDLQEQHSWMQRVNPARSRAVFYFCTLSQPQTHTHPRSHTVYHTNSPWALPVPRLVHRWFIVRQN